MANEIDSELEHGVVDLSTQKDDLRFIKFSNIKTMLNSCENLNFKNLLIDVFKRLKARTFLDVKKINYEIDNMPNISIDVSDFRATDTDFREFALLISKLDSLRSRLSDVLSDAQNDYDALDTWYKELREIWISRSSGKSSDKREGESTEILFFLTPEKIARRSLLNKVKNKFSSIGSKIDSISREITIGQELRKNIK